MIKNTTPVPLDLSVVMATVCISDRRFVTEQFTAAQLLDIRKTIIESPPTFRDVKVLNYFLQIKTRLYLGDAPDLIKYQNCTNLEIWTPTVYAQNTAMIYQMSPQWYSLYFDNFDWEYQETTPSKHFNCFINRMDVNRQSWLYLLVRRNLFDKGFVSFNMDVSRLDNYDPAESASAVFDRQFQTHMSNFEIEHKVVRSIVPYRNFDTEDIGTVIMQSQFGIVLETYFAAPDEITFTEKTFRALVFPRPWLLYASPYAVQTLRNWGFDVLDDLVDHAAYDSVEDSIQRQTIILDLAQTMCNFDVAAHQARLQQAAVHNLSLLKQWRADLPDIVRKDTEQFLDKVYELYGGN